MTNFKPGAVADTTSFYGDPNNSALMFTTSIEKSPITYCHISSLVSVVRVGGGVVKSGLITYTPLTYADRTTYLNTKIDFNYSITTVEDVGTYEVTI